MLQGVFLGSRLSRFRGLKSSFALKVPLEQQRKTRLPGAPCHLNTSSARTTNYSKSHHDDDYRIYGVLFRTGGAFRSQWTLNAMSYTCNVEGMLCKLSHELQDVDL